MKFFDLGVLRKVIGLQPARQSYWGKYSDDVFYAKLAKGRRELKLTSSEKKEIRQRWGAIVPGPLCVGYSYYRILKSIGAYSPDYLPSSYYMPYIYERLNPAKFIPILTHKGLTSLFYNDVEQPRTVVCSIAGLLFDADYRQLTCNEAVKLIRECAADMIFKPATDTWQGHGVQLITAQTEDIEKLLRSCPDFIIQNRVVQSEFMNRFNASSLNCIRFTSLNINGRATVTNTAIKLGASGSIVDNIGSGSGTMIGISKDGIMGKRGFRIDGTICKSHNGISFGGCRIPGFEHARELVEGLHSKVPTIGVIGWDIAFTTNDRPILIEANIYWPGITVEQMACGPIFAERTDEVVAYLSAKS